MAVRGVRSLKSLKRLAVFRRDFRVIPSQNKPSQSGSEKRKKIPESIHKLLKEAFETHKKEGWVALSRASSYIKDKQPDFSLKEYYSKFYKLIQDFPEKYKLEKSHKKYQCK